MHVRGWAEGGLREGRADSGVAGKEFGSTRAVRAHAHPCTRTHRRALAHTHITHTYTGWQKRTQGLKCARPAQPSAAPRSPSLLLETVWWRGEFIGRGARRAKAKPLPLRVLSLSRTPSRPSASPLSGPGARGSERGRRNLQRGVCRPLNRNSWRAVVAAVSMLVWTRGTLRGMGRFGISSNGVLGVGYKEQNRLYFRVYTRTASARDDSAII